MATTNANAHNPVKLLLLLDARTGALDRAARSPASCPPLTVRHKQTTIVVGIPAGKWIIAREMEFVKMFAHLAEP